MHTAISLRRPSCERCERPRAACLCLLALPVPHRTPVLILQHPLERHHPKGSGRLLHLSLPHSRLEVGERFDEEQLAAWLGPDAVLLYPGGEGADLPAEPGRLVVIDATWRKSRLMRHANPLLARLPRLSLDAPPPSRYRVRRAHRPEQRSTLEATLLALERLEGPHPSHVGLLAAFDSLQAAWHGRAAKGA